jgi:hypothetical protein
MPDQTRTDYLMGRINAQIDRRAQSSETVMRQDAGRIASGTVSSATINLSQLAQGGATANQVLAWNSGASEWQPVTNSATLPWTSAGDLLYYDGGSAQRLAIGTAGQVLTVNAGATAPEWQTGGGGGGPAIDQGTYGALPTGSEDDVYLATDAPYILRKGASAWSAFGPIQQLVVPPSSGWSWDNQDGSSVDSTAGELQFSSPQTASSAELSVYYRSAPSTPYTVTALIALAPCIGSGGFPGFGLCFGDGSGQWVHFAIQPTQGRVIWNEYTNATTYSASPLIFSGVHTEPWLAPVWVRIQDDGANRISSISTTGRQWQTLRTVTRTDFLTATRVGIACQRSTSAEPLPYALLSWEES